MTKGRSGSGRTAHGAYALVLAALALLASPARLAAAAPPPPVVLTAAEFVESSAMAPPPDTAAWKPARLPDNWHVSRPRFRGTLWYRASFDVPADGLVTHALYVPRNSATEMTFWINGYRLAASRAYGDPHLTELQQPLIFTVPAVMLKPGRNALAVRVAGEAQYRHGLPRMTIGYGLAVRRAHYEPRYHLQVTSTAMIASALALAGLLALRLWRADRRDPVLFWFGVTAFAGAAWAALQLWPLDIRDDRLRHLLLFFLKYAYATPLLVLCLRYGEIRSRTAEAALWTLFAGGCAAALILQDDAYPHLGTAALSAYVALFTVLLGWVAVKLLRSAQWRAYLLFAALAASVLVYGYDLARWMGYADFDALLLTPYATVFLILALGATVVDRHLRTVRALDASNRDLERRIAEKVDEVQRSYARVAAVMREQTVLRERSRIMADMHDGLGSSLVSLLSRVQSGRIEPTEIERRLSATIMELRAIVDSLEPVDGDLAAVLGNVRYRMRAAIEDSGARFVWDVDELPRVEQLTPEVILAIERILLEVLSNALQHAGARTVTFSARVVEDGSLVRIEVADDGGGFDANAGGAGRGLRTMMERAHRTGIRVNVESRTGPEHGTTVTVDVPLARGPAPATAPAAPRETP